MVLGRLLLRAMQGSSLIVRCVILGCAQDPPQPPKGIYVHFCNPTGARKIILAAAAALSCTSFRSSERSIHLVLRTMENPDRSELTKFVIPATIMLSFISFWRA